MEPAALANMDIPNPNTMRAIPNTIKPGDAISNPIPAIARRGASIAIPARKASNGIIPEIPISANIPAAIPNTNSAAANSNNGATNQSNA